MLHAPSLSGTPQRARRWRIRLDRLAGRIDFYPQLEIGSAALAILLGFASYAVLTGKHAPAEGFSPPVVSLLLVANLIPVMALIVLIARRVILLVTAQRQGRAGSRLHLRLVALFAAVAAVPTLLVVAFAALLFQYGVQFWFSDRARTVLDNADRVAQAYVQENVDRIAADIDAMAGDMRLNAEDFGIESENFREAFNYQVPRRNLTEAIVFELGPGGPRTFASAGPTQSPLELRIDSQALARARAGATQVLITNSGDRVQAIERIDPTRERYLYVSRLVDPRVVQQVSVGREAVTDYRSLIERSRVLQWRFNLMLVLVSLLLLAAAIWAALWLANRMVNPIGRLVLAAERVGAGDLTARVPLRDAPHEIGTLARTFNRMTHQLEAQQGALMSANEQLDRRRQFTEAVLAGVSAGVLSIDGEGVVQLANRSAAELLEVEEDTLIGSRLDAVVPELAAMVEAAGAKRETRGEVEIVRGTDTQTLVVRVVQPAGGGDGYVLTFDDISQQLADQRRAAWADVARRIAHEIKNPLTPIQLSAERLQRKYGRQVEEDPQTFASLTSTIVRQVGDLRRMVDEFSSFARMPKPEFRPEPLLDIARQTLLLQEVAHPTIAFELEAPQALPLLVCDRRQIAQALTNLLKNAAESVAARQEREGGEGRVRLAVDLRPDELAISVTDDGVGLPEQRDRLTEPYVTTRSRGTGLGLAIVKKIVEEHAGTLELVDAEGGGAIVTMRFDTGVLAQRAQPAPADESGRERMQG